MDELVDRNVLITGAAGGIGRALADVAIRAGANVTLTDLDLGPLAAYRDSARTRTALLNVADESAWKTLPVPDDGWDFVALNAGVMSAPPEANPEASDFLALPPDRYRRIVDVNVHGIAFGMRSTLPALSETGAIVATASAAGLVGYGLDPAYSMTKHAVVGLVRAIASQLERTEKGRRVCAICPGGVQTAIVPTYARAIPMMDPRVIAEEIADLWIAGENGEIRARIRADLPAQRIGEPPLHGWGTA
ncbi:MAG: SDR family NAD(P)-dependent oxidoreductase [Myxococcota bacterium]